MKAETLTTQEMIELYEEGNSTAEIGKLCGIHGSSVYERFKRVGYTLRNNHEVAILAVCNQAGVFMDRKGYLRFSRGKYSNRPVAIVVIEQHLGRRLQKGEVVHHKDGDKLNNDPTNLELMSIGEHMELHHAMKRGMYE